MRSKDPPSLGGGDPRSAAQPAAGWEIKTTMVLWHVRPPPFTKAGATHCLPVSPSLRPPLSAPLFPSPPSHHPTSHHHFVPRDYSAHTRVLAQTSNGPPPWYFAQRMSTLPTIPSPFVQEQLSAMRFNFPPCSLELASQHNVLRIGACKTVVGCFFRVALLASKGPRVALDWGGYLTACVCVCGPCS